MQVFDTRHLLAHKNGLVADVLSELVEQSTERIKELLNLGSVYVDKTRITENKHIQENTYLRIHLKPKRYDVHSIDWKNRIVFENENFFILNKPKNLPVNPMVDNLFENVVYQLSKFLGYPVLITHRLDVPTEGLLVMAKTKEFQTAFNKLFIHKQIVKKYQAKVESLIPSGEYVHFMKHAPSSPKLMRSEAFENSLKCILKVEACEESNRFYVAKIDLLTGRTHQIRAQLSHMGFPLVGDKIYGSKLEESLFSLRCYQLSFACPLTSHQFNFLI